MKSSLSGPSLRRFARGLVRWLTFSHLSSLIAIPNFDADIVGAMADYRPDLFAVSRDRRMKVKTEVAEDVARRGPNWQVRQGPKQVPFGSFQQHRDKEAGSTENVCYCSVPDDEILGDLTDDSVPDEALVFSCCWKNICRVRDYSSV